MKRSIVDENSKGESNNYKIWKHKVMMIDRKINRLIVNEWHWKVVMEQQFRKWAAVNRVRDWPQRQYVAIDQGTRKWLCRRDISHRTTALHLKHNRYILQCHISSPSFIEQTTKNTQNRNPILQSSTQSHTNTHTWIHRPVIARWRHTNEGRQSIEGNPITITIELPILMWHASSLPPSIWSSESVAICSYKVMFIVMFTLKVSSIMNHQLPPGWMQLSYRVRSTNGTSKRWNDN